MTREEAIIFAQYSQTLTELKDVKEFYALAEAALREQEERRWIPVTERLPEKNDRFICSYKFNSNSKMMFVGVLDYYAADTNPHWQNESAGVIVTHWMPMPEPPEEDDNA